MSSGDGRRYFDKNKCVAVAGTQNDSEKISLSRKLQFGS